MVMRNWVCVDAGIRLEDDLVVTAKGVKTLTNVPRTVRDVEAVMAGGEWPEVPQK